MFARAWGMKMMAVLVHRQTDLHAHSSYLEDLEMKAEYLGNVIFSQSPFLTITQVQRFERVRYNRRVQSRNCNTFGSQVVWNFIRPRSTDLTIC